MKSVLQAIRDRRSQKTFTSAAVSDDDMRTMLDAAVLAPNHKLTQPWFFAVLGHFARQRYAEIKADERVREIPDATVAAEKRARIVADTGAVPAVVVVLQKLAGDAHREREDYAAVFMAIENILLVATSMGLGSKVHTGDVINEPGLRELVQAQPDEQIVAIIHLGEPAEAMKPKARIPATERTRWLP